MRSEQNKRRAVGQVTLLMLVSWNTQQAFAEDMSVSHTAPRSVPTQIALPDNDVHDLIKEDVVGSLIQAQKYHQSRVRSYSCRLQKQETLDGRLGEQSQMQVRFKQGPFSVAIQWDRNGGRVKSALYVKDRWLDLKAKRVQERQLACFKPSGVAGAFVSSVKRAIHGADARECSLYALDEFGFDNALERLIRASTDSDGRSLLALVGTNRHDGRPTWLLRRDTPFVDADHRISCATVDIELDKEWLVPVAVRFYRDKQRTELFAMYEFYDVQMNAGLSDRDFDPGTYDM
jgi:hypothetical protein